MEAILTVQKAELRTATETVYTVIHITKNCAHLVFENEDYNAEINKGRQWSDLCTIKIFGPWNRRKNEKMRWVGKRGKLWSIWSVEDNKKQKGEEGGFWRRKISLRFAIAPSCVLFPLFCNSGVLSISLRGRGFAKAAWGIAQQLLLYSKQGGGQQSWGVDSVDAVILMMLMMLVHI